MRPQTFASYSSWRYNRDVNALYTAAKEVSGFLAARRWRFCIIGGLAVIRWGEMRTTLDVDFTLLTGFGQETDFARPLLERFAPRVDNALEFVIQKRVLLLRADNGKDVDISFGAFPFEEAMIRRATPFEFASGVSLITCSAEDLFILKMFAGRGKDWTDAEGVAIRQKLDVRYILRHLRPLSELKEDSEMIDRARKLLKSAHE
jgi:hypothetical protein